MSHTNDNQFLNLLRKNRDKRFFVAAPAGNSGDELLRLGLTQYLERGAYLLVDEPKRADVILLHGGGNLDDVWHCGTELFISLAVAYTKTPIIVAPSTAHFFTTDFARVLGACTQNIYLFARERYTYERLQKLTLPPHISLGLADDTAFLLSDSAYLESIKLKRSSDYVLFALRTDRESAILDCEYDPNTRGVRARLRHWNINRHLRRWCRRHHADVLLRHRAVFMDVSHKDLDTFAATIARASAIYTDRLHVAILAALLEKPVYLYPTKYDKVQGVYHETLYRYPTVVPMFLESAGTR